MIQRAPKISALWSVLRQAQDEVRRRDPNGMPSADLILSLSKDGPAGSKIGAIWNVL